MTDKIVCVTLLAATVLGGAVAYAYPPGTQMSVSVVTTAAAAEGSRLTVLVTESNPDCGLRLSVGEVSLDVGKGHPEEFVRTLDIAADRGRHTLSVRAVACERSEQESARAGFLLLKPHVDTKSTIKHGSPFTVTVKDFPPRARFSVVPSGPAAAVQPAPWEGTTNDRGLGKVKIALPAPGSWSLTATGDGVTASATIEVR